MFSNIGWKIKTVAVVFCWFGIIGSIFIGIMYGTSLEVLPASARVLVGILSIIFGSLLSWVSSFFIYGFGQLIENTDFLVDNTDDLVRNVSNKRKRKQKSAIEFRKTNDSKNANDLDCMDEYDQ